MTSLFASGGFCKSSCSSLLNPPFWLVAHSCVLALIRKGSFKIWTWFIHEIMLFICVRVCVSSNCKASGRLTWPTEPASLSTTSTDWWPSAVPGMNLRQSACWWQAQGTVGVSVGAFWPVWEPDGLCLHRASFACARAICQLGLSLSSTFFSPTQSASRTLHLPSNLAFCLEVNINDLAEEPLLKYNN